MDKDLYELANNDLATYCAVVDEDYDPQDFHIKITNLLQDIYEGKVKRAIICMPPGHGKSRNVSQIFPARGIQKDPKKRFVVASYGQDLADHQSLASKTVTTQDINKDIFEPLELVQDNTKHRQTKQGGFYHAVGVGGPLTGYRYDIGIIDDPVKSRAEADSVAYRSKVNDWYKSVFATRIAGDDSAIIIMCTRWHVDDLVGFVEKHTNQERTKLVIPVYTKNKDKKETIRPERYSLKIIEEARLMMGVRDFSALYMQDPISSTGSIFKPPFSYKEYSETFEQTNGYKKIDMEVGVFIDPAFSTNKDSDDCAIIVMGRHKITKELFILDGFADTTPPSESIDKSFRLADKRRIYGFTISFMSIEVVDLSQKQSQFVKQFKQEMLNRGVQYKIYEYRPRIEKITRITMHSEPRFANKTIHIVRAGGDTSRMQKLEQQMTSFPNCDKFDILDCVTQGIQVWQQIGVKIDKNPLETRKKIFNKITGQRE